MSDLCWKAERYSFADKIKVKLASWKGALLTIMGRVQLVRAIIHGMLIYSFQVYTWPKALLKQLDRWIRNFIWSGDVTTKKICTIARRNIYICKPYEEGGLNTRSLTQVNESLLLHLCWKFLSSNEQWAVMCHTRFLKWGQPSNAFFKSSNWHGIKKHVTVVKENPWWIIGTGNNVAFWLDNWLSVTLTEMFNIPASAYHLLTATVSEYIADGEWNIPECIMQKDPTFRSLIDKVIIPRQPLEDRLV
ncbi:ribonuclease H, partial [Trifolium medium]|nr:ribonuclease H [Trifolium medium]